MLPLPVQAVVHQTGNIFKDLGAQLELAVRESATTNSSFVTRSQNRQDVCNFPEKSISFFYRQSSPPNPQTLDSSIDDRVSTHKLFKPLLYSTEVMMLPDTLRGWLRFQCSGRQALHYRVLQMPGVSNPKQIRLFWPLWLKTSRQAAGDSLPSYARTEPSIMDFLIRFCALPESDAVCVWPSFCLSSLLSFYWAGFPLQSY